MLRNAVRTISRKARILIVEDEGLIAHDIAARLERAGYSVAGIADSGEEALRKVVESKPDLVLMDIRINGNIDGVETASRLRERSDIPVIYLTAHSDGDTLDRAKVTEPFGYLTKPLQESNLQNSIEMALYKHRMEREQRQQRARLTAVLRNMGEAVIVMDGGHAIQLMNSTAERLTGWTTAEAMNKNLFTVLEIVDCNLQHLRESHLAELLPEDELAVSLPRGITALNRAGQVYRIEGEIVSSLKGDETFGTVINFRDATVRRKEEYVVRQEQKMEAVGRLASSVGHEFTTILTNLRREAEQALEQPSLDSGLRAAWENMLRSTDAGKTFVEQLLMFGYVWTA